MTFSDFWHNVKLIIEVVAQAALVIAFYVGILVFVVVMIEIAFAYRQRRNTKKQHKTL